MATLDKQLQGYRGHPRQVFSTLNYIVHTEHDHEHKRGVRIRLRNISNLHESV